MSTRVHRPTRRRPWRLPDRAQVALTLAAFGVVMGVILAAYLGLAPR